MTVRVELILRLWQATGVAEQAGKGKSLTIFVRLIIMNLGGQKLIEACTYLDAK